MTSNCKLFIPHDICNIFLCGLEPSFYPDFWDTILLIFRNCSGHSVNPFAFVILLNSPWKCGFLRIPFFGSFCSQLNCILCGWPTNSHSFKCHLSAVFSMRKQYNLAFESRCFIIKQTWVLLLSARHLTSSSLSFFINKGYNKMYQKVVIKIIPASTS